MEKIRAFLSWMQNAVEITEPVSLLKVYSGVRGKEPQMQMRLWKDSSGCVGGQLSSKNQVHATRTKVESKSTGELPNFTSEQILHFYESRDNKLFPLVIQLFIEDSGQYLRPDGMLPRRESSTWSRIALLGTSYSHSFLLSTREAREFKSPRRPFLTP